MWTHDDLNKAFKHWQEMKREGSDLFSNHPEIEAAWKQYCKIRDWLFDPKRPEHFTREDLNSFEDTTP